MFEGLRGEARRVREEGRSAAAARTAAQYDEAIQGVPEQGLEPEVAALLEESLRLDRNQQLGRLGFTGANEQES